MTLKLRWTCEPRTPTGTGTFWKLRDLSWHGLGKKAQQHLEPRPPAPPEAVVAAPIHTMDNRAGAGLATLHMGPLGCSLQALKRTDLTTGKWSSGKFNSLSKKVEVELVSKTQSEQAKPGMSRPLCPLTMPGLRVQVVPGTDGSFSGPVGHSYLVTILQRGTGFLGRISKTNPPLSFVDGLRVPKERSSSLSVHFPLSKMLFSWSCSAKPSPELQKLKRQETSPSATPGFLGPRWRCWLHARPGWPRDMHSIF